MKKIIILFSFAALVSLTASAQKYAIIDTKYILEKLKDYKDADKSIQVTADKWQKELDSMQADLDKMYKNFDAEQYMLTDELKKKREAELFNKEKEVRELQRKRFGYEGDLFKERQRLVKPIQDKVFNAIQKLSVARGWDFVLDKRHNCYICRPKIG
jgi:outer membrane protein